MQFLHGFGQDMRKSWRASSSASLSSFAVISASWVSASSGRRMSRTSPSTRAAIAALARPGPMAAAISAGVVPRATSRSEPSGRVTRIMSDIGIACFQDGLEWPLCQSGRVAARAKPWRLAAGPVCAISIHTKRRRGCAGAQRSALSANAGPKHLPGAGRGCEAPVGRTIVRNCALPSHKPLRLACGDPPPS
jgi:hypothetical protein